jgi:hypothetical protein
MVLIADVYGGRASRTFIHILQSFNHTNTTQHNTTLNQQLPPAAAAEQGEEEGAAAPAAGAGTANAGYCIVEYDNYPAAQKAHRIGESFEGRGDVIDGAMGGLGGGVGDCRCGYLG